MADRQKLLLVGGLALVGYGLVTMGGGAGASSGSSGSSGSTGDFPAPGTLVNPIGKYVGDISQAWVMGSDGKIHGVPGFATFQACHFPGGVCQPIDPALFAKIPQGAPVTFPSCWPPVCGDAAAQQRAAHGLPAPSKTDCPNG